jgi:hypothetical protein
MILMEQQTLAGLISPDANALAPNLIVWNCIHSQGDDGLDNHLTSR